MSLAEKLLPQIRSILSKSDLSTVSAKAVRKELVRRGADADEVKANRDAIDEKISSIYDELTAHPSPPSSTDVPLNSSRATGQSSSSFPPMPQSSQPIPLQDTKPVKREIKEERHNLGGPSNAAANGHDGAAETDAMMAARLQAEFDALGSGRASRSAGTGRAKKVKKAGAKRKSRAEVGSDEDGEAAPKKRRGGGGGSFNKELMLSDPLAALLGESRLSRPQTVKRIWQYVKENDLQDPSDKRFIRCDDPLRAVFHTDKVHMFTMNKILAAHFMEPDEIAYRDETKPAVRHPPRSAAKVETAEINPGPVEIVNDHDLESEEDEDGYY